MSASGRHNGDAALLAALAGGASHQEAAALAGVSERTAYRRLEDPAFRQQLAGARSELIARATGRLAAACSAAAATLAGLLKADSETVRLGAARSILELAIKLRDAEELEARIATLEEQAELRKRQEPSRGVRSWGA